MLTTKLINSFFLVLLLVVNVNCLDCNSFDNTKSLGGYDQFNFGKESISAEYKLDLNYRDGNDDSNGYTITEYFDTKAKSGRIGKLPNDTIYAYFPESGESFLVQKYQCTLFDFKKDQLLKWSRSFLPELLIQLNPKYFSEHVGAITIVRSIQDINFNFKYKRDESNSKNNFRYCGEKNNLIIDVSFGSRYETIIIRTRQEGKKYKAIKFSFSKLEGSSQKPEALKVAPAGYGCSRKDITQKLKPLRFKGERFQMNIVATEQNFESDDMNTVNQDSFKLHFDKTINVLSFTSVDTDNPIKVQHIADLTSVLGYEIKTNTTSKTSKCNMNQIFKEPVKYTKWPFTNKEKINILHLALLDILNVNYTFLGEYNNEENQKTLIFEKLVYDIDVDGVNHTFLLTDYRAPSSMFASLETAGPPRSIKIQMFRGNERETLVKDIFLKINDYNEYFWERDIFNISSCSTHSKTIRLEFSVPSFRIPRDYTFKTKFENSFIATLPKMSQLRISKVTLQIPARPLFRSYYSVRLRLMAKLLERPNLKLYFTEFSTAKFKNTYKVEEKISSIDKCIEFCYQKEYCQGCSFNEHDGCSLINKTQNLVIEKADSSVSFEKNVQTYEPSNFEIFKSLKTQMLKRNYFIQIPSIRIPFRPIDIKDFDDIIMYGTDDDEPLEIEENGREFPDISNLIANQTSLTTKVEIVNRERKVNRYYEEYYHYKAQRGQLKFLSLDSGPITTNLYDFLFFYDTNEYFKIGNGKCETKKIDERKTVLTDEGIFPKDLFNELGNFTLEVVGPTALLNYAYLARNNMKKSNQTISAVSITSAWETTVGKFKLVYFFWSLDTVTEIPLTVKIYRGDLLIQSMNYATFKVDSDNNKLLSIPDGYGCKRIESKQEFPAMLFDTDYSVMLEMEEIMFKDNEISFSETQTISFARNSKYDLSAYETKVSLDTNRPHPQRYVYDGVNNILYGTDLFIGRCNYSVKRSGSLLKWPRNVDINILDGTVWSYDDETQFLGETLQRGIPVLVFEKVNKTFYKGDDGVTYPAVITHYFAKNNTFDDNILGNFPLRIQIRLYRNERRSDLFLYLTINSHDFQLLFDISKQAEKFDISNCFLNPNQHTWFRISFPIDWEIFTLTQQKNAIEQAFRTELGKLIPQSRLPKVIVDITSMAVFITGRFLERPPFQLAFSKQENKQYGKLLDYSFITQSLDSCGQTCHDNENCISFSYCKNFQCDIFINDGKNSNATKDEPNCDVYIRLTDDNNEKPLLIQDLTSNYILGQVEVRVKLGDFSIVIPEQNEDEKKIAELTLKGSKFMRNIEPGLSNDLIRYDRKLTKNPDTDNDETFTTFLNYYLSRRSAKIDLKQGLNRKVPSISSYDCRKICDNTEYCESFTYCSDSEGKKKECIISSLHGSEITRNNTNVNSDCNILSKRFLSKYTEHGPGKLDAQAKLSVSAQTIDECAKTCTQSSDFKCESFDACRKDLRSNLTCNLYTSHVLADNNLTKTGLVSDAECLHYSMKYTYDYLLRPKYKLPMKKLIVSTALSAESCASECNEMGARKCLAFEYCDEVNPSTHVILNTCRVSAEAINENALVATEKCNVYIRDSKLAIEQTSDANERYSTGLGVFLGLLFFVIGLASVIAGIWIYFNKFQNN